MNPLPPPAEGLLRSSNLSDDAIPRTPLGTTPPPRLRPGQFPPSSFGTIDTGPLRHDLFRLIRRHPERTRLWQALHLSAARVFTAPNVIAEMDRDLPMHAAKANVELEVARTQWETQYRPWLRVVDVSDLVPEVGDHPDVLAVYARGSDGPLALLSALLGVRAWTEDKDLGVLGIGRELWLSHAVATVDEAQLSSVGAVAYIATAKSIEVTASQAVALYRKAELTIGRPATLLLSALLALGAVWYLWDDDRRKLVLDSHVMRGLGSATGSLMTVAVDMHTRHEAANGFLQQHLRDDPRPPTIHMRLARVLAGARHPLAVEEIAQQASVSAAVASAVLNNHTAFVSDPYGRWELGSLLTPRVEEPPHSWTQVTQLKSLARASLERTSLHVGSIGLQYEVDDVACHALLIRMTQTASATIRRGRGEFVIRVRPSNPTSTSMTASECCRGRIPFGAPVASTTFSML